jgi:hypothetical protein
MKKIKRLISCKLFKYHNWTSNYNEDIPPTEDQLGSIKGFWDYAKMYCKDCGAESKFNK